MTDNPDAYMRAHRLDTIFKVLFPIVHSFSYIDFVGGDAAVSREKTGETTEGCFVGYPGCRGHCQP